MTPTDAPPQPQDGVTEQVYIRMRVVVKHLLAIGPELTAFYAIFGSITHQAY
jgi:hypothetical protein